MAEAAAPAEEQANTPEFYAYYQALGLVPYASFKEVKTAFIELTKKYQDDPARFTAIYRAYAALLKELNQKIDYYEVLGLAKDASLGDMHRAFSELVKMFDTGADEENKTACQLIYEAYTALSGKKANFYLLLGLPKDADMQAIKRAYRKAALLLHPDKSAAVAPEVFQLVLDAHTTLTDPEQRAIYDGKLEQDSNSGPGAPAVPAGDLYFQFTQDIPTPAPSQPTAAAASEDRSLVQPPAARQYTASINITQKVRSNELAAQQLVKLCQQNSELLNAVLMHTPTALLLPLESQLRLLALAALAQKLNIFEGLGGFVFRQLALDTEYQNEFWTKKPPTAVVDALRQRVSEFTDPCMLLWVLYDRKYISTYLKTCPTLRRANRIATTYKTPLRNLLVEHGSSLLLDKLALVEELQLALTTNKTFEAAHAEKIRALGLDAVIITNDPAAVLFIWAALTDIEPAEFQALWASLNADEMKFVLKYFVDTGFLNSNMPRRSIANVMSVLANDTQFFRTFLQVTAPADVKPEQYHPFLERLSRLLVAPKTAFLAFQVFYKHPAALACYLANTDVTQLTPELIQRLHGLYVMHRLEIPVAAFEQIVKAKAEWQDFKHKDIDQENFARLFAITGLVKEVFETYPTAVASKIYAIQAYAKADPMLRRSLALDRYTAPTWIRSILEKGTTEEIQGFLALSKNDGRDLYFTQIISVLLENRDLCIKLYQQHQDWFKASVPVSVLYQVELKASHWREDAFCRAVSGDTAKLAIFVDDDVKPSFTAYAIAMDAVSDFRGLYDQFQRMAEGLVGIDIDIHAWNRIDQALRASHALRPNMEWLLLRDHRYKLSPEVKLILQNKKLDYRCNPIDNTYNLYLVRTLLSVAGSSLKVSWVQRTLHEISKSKKQSHEYASFAAVFSTYGFVLVDPAVLEAQLRQPGKAVLLTPKTGEALLAECIREIDEVLLQENEASVALAIEKLNTCLRDRSLEISEHFARAQALASSYPITAKGKIPFARLWLIRAASHDKVAADLVVTKVRDGKINPLELFESLNAKDGHSFLRFLASTEPLAKEFSTIMETALSKAELPKALEELFAAEYRLAAGRQEHLAFAQRLPEEIQQKLRFRFYQYATQCHNKQRRTEDYRAREFEWPAQEQALANSPFALLLVVGKITWQDFLKYENNYGRVKDNRIFKAWVQYHAKQPAPVDINTVCVGIGDFADIKQFSSLQLFTHENVLAADADKKSLLPFFETEHAAALSLLVKQLEIDQYGPSKKPYTAETMPQLKQWMEVLRSLHNFMADITPDDWLNADKFAQFKALVATATQGDNPIPQERGDFLKFISDIFSGDASANSLLDFLLRAYLKVYSDREKSPAFFEAILRQGAKKLSPEVIECIAVAVVRNRYVSLGFEKIAKLFPESTSAVFAALLSKGIQPADIRSLEHSYPVLKPVTVAYAKQILAKTGSGSASLEDPVFEALVQLWLNTNNEEATLEKLAASPRVCALLRYPSTRAWLLSEIESGSIDSHLRELFKDDVKARPLYSVDTGTILLFPVVNSEFFFSHSLSNTVSAPAGSYEASILQEIRASENELGFSHFNQGYVILVRQRRALDSYWYASENTPSRTFIADIQPIARVVDAQHAVLLECKTQKRSNFYTAMRLAIMDEKFTISPKLKGMDYTSLPENGLEVISTLLREFPAQTDRIKTITLREFGEAAWHLVERYMARLPKSEPARPALKAVPVPSQEPPAPPSPLADSESEAEEDDDAQEMSASAGRAAPAREEHPKGEGSSSTPRADEDPEEEGDAPPQAPARPVQPKPALKHTATHGVENDLGNAKPSSFVRALYSEFLEPLLGETDFDEDAYAQKARQLQDIVMHNYFKVLEQKVLAALESERVRLAADKGGPLTEKGDKKAGILAKAKTDLETIVRTQIRNTVFADSAPNFQLNTFLADLHKAVLAKVKSYANDATLQASRSPLTTFFRGLVGVLVAACFAFIPLIFSAYRQTMFGTTSGTAVENMRDNLAPPVVAIKA